MTGKGTSSHYLPDIQGLRALAVFLVIFYHSGLPGLPGGYIGVDVFFVISGYLITGLLLRELEHHHSISLGRFYARRFRRLLPAATLVLAVTLTVAWFVYSPLELKIFSSSAFATSVYLSNVWFAHLATDYLAEDTDANPLLHTWSLGVEEQFYLVWPMLILLTFRYGPRETMYRRLTIVLGALVVVSFGLSLWLTEHNQPWAFFGSPTRAWEFGAGGLVALWSSRGFSMREERALILGWVGLGLIAHGAITFDRTTPFPGLAALLPAVGAACVIAASHTENLRGANRFLATRPMQLVGDMSYSLYLWHWPVFVFLVEAWGEPDLPVVLATIAIVFVLSWLTLVLVENPIRFNRRLSARVMQSIAFGGALTAASAALAFGVRNIAAITLQDPLQKIFMEAKADLPRIYADGCHLDQFVTEPQDCTYGSPDSEYTVVLFGDSHAAHWFPPLEKMANEQDWKLLTFTKSGCPSALYEPFNELMARNYKECTEWRENVLRHLESIRPGLVVVSNIYTYDTAPAQWKTAMDGLLVRLSPVSDRIVVINDIPQAFRRIPHCLSHAAWLSVDFYDHCQIKRSDSRAADMRTAERNAASRFGNVSVIDLSDVICGQPRCEVYSEGMVKYSDNNHLTATYSRSLKDHLSQRLFFNHQSACRRPPCSPPTRGGGQGHEKPEHPAVNDREGRRLRRTLTLYDTIAPRFLNK